LKRRRYRPVQKFGVEVEGTHRRLAFRDGEYVDGYSIARIKP
jgi:RimJ/RimL family protein N-acetyltransferase